MREQMLGLVQPKQQSCLDCGVCFCSSVGGEGMLSRGNQGRLQDLNLGAL